MGKPETQGIRCCCMLYLWMQMRGTVVVKIRGGHRMARGWRYTKPSLASALFRVACVLSCMLSPCIRCIFCVPCASLILSIFCGICLLFSFLSFCRFLPCFCFCFYALVRAFFVDGPQIFSCPAGHVPDWQPLVLLGMIDGKYTHTHTHTHTQT